MGDHRHTLELNGKRYDAVTGKTVTEAIKTNKIPSPSHPQVSRNIDGIIHQGVKKAPARAIHTKPAKSQTLMRSAVAKPHISATLPHTDVKDESFSARKLLEESRLRRAKKIPTNKLISRFGTPQFASTKVTVRHTTVPVKPEPPSIVTTKASPSIQSPKPSHFQTQLDNASAHVAKPLKKPKLRHRTAKKLHVSSKRLGIGTIVVVVVLLSGFIAYQNASVIAIRVAASRAGIAASVPGYTPAGFALKSHSAQTGQITIGYRSNSDNRAYKITQTLSSWDSSTLLENFVANSSYQATNSKGRTVYLYSGNNATWVDNGIWYRVEGDNSLSGDQLQHVIDSI